MAFSLERAPTRTSSGVAAGAAVAALDADGGRDSHLIDLDVFYWLGFDIATGLYGKADQGALGYTATGPGAYKIRRLALGAGGQRGFNAAVYFHLGANNNPTLATGEGPVEIGSGWQEFGQSRGPDSSFCTGGSVAGVGPLA